MNKEYIDFLKVIHADHTVNGSHRIKARQLLESLEQQPQNSLDSGGVSDERRILEGIWSIRDLLRYGGEVAEEHADEAAIIDSMLTQVDIILSQPMPFVNILRFWVLFGFS